MAKETKEVEKVNIKKYRKRINFETYNTREITEKYVYRYITIEKLIDFLETGELYLTRLDKFEDNLEGMEPYDITELISRTKVAAIKNPNPTIWDTVIKIMKNAKNYLNLLQKKILDRQKHYFVSCWILSDVESFAMWDIYGKSGFAVRFEYKNFIDAIQNSSGAQTHPTSSMDIMVAGNVVYQNFDEIPFKEKDSKLKYKGFRKHLSFNHENEFRVVGMMNEIIDREGLRFKLDGFASLEFEIIANPRLNDFQFEKFQSIISHYSRKQELKESRLKLWLEFRGLNYDTKYPDLG